MRKKSATIDWIMVTKDRATWPPETMDHVITLHSYDFTAFGRGAWRIDIGGRITTIACERGADARYACLQNIALAPYAWSKMPTFPERV